MAMVGATVPGIYDFISFISFSLTSNPGTVGIWKENRVSGNAGAQSLGSGISFTAAQHYQVQERFSFMTSTRKR